MWYFAPHTTNICEVNSLHQRKNFNSWWRKVRKIARTASTHHTSDIIKRSREAVAWKPTARITLRRRLVKYETKYRTIPIQGVKSTCNPMFESVSYGLRPKESSFDFLPLKLRGRKIDRTLSQWYQNSEIYVHFIDAVKDINRWKFQRDPPFGVAITGIQAFSEVRSFDVTWWTDLEWPGSKIFKSCAEKMYKKVCKKNHGGAPRCCFWDICKKNLKDMSKHPPPPTGSVLIQFTSNHRPLYTWPLYMIWL